MEQVLKAHKQQYPHMEIQDTAKLLYQSEFGGGHIIANEDTSLEFIKEEYGVYSEKGWPNADRPLVVPIGNGLCRVDLAVLDKGLCPETLNQMFVKTANQVKGSVGNLEEKIKSLNLQQDPWIFQWKEKDYPPIHHSKEFRDNYHPAYRVVRKKYADYLPILSAIDRLMDKKAKEEQILVGIDGPCTSGKTTLGEILKELYDCNVFHMDDFFLRPEQKSEERLSQIGGNVDYERFQKEILSCLRQSEEVEYQVYSCKEERLTHQVKAPYKRLNIVEGSYSQHPYFKDAYDLRIFLDIDKETQLNRILKRNGAQMLKRFEEEWIPKENQYFEKFQIREKSIGNIFK